MSLRLLYQLHLEIPVWQIRLDPDQPWLAVELRDGEKLMATFSVLNYRTGATLLPPKQTIELWWTGLEAFGHGILLTHGFGPEGYGQHQGLTAINISTGAILWSEKEYKFAGLTADKVLVQPAHAAEPATTFLGLIPQTGEVIAPNISATQAQKLVSDFEVNRQRALQLPRQYPEGSDYFADIQQFVHLKTTLQPVWAIDYLETATCFAIGLYTEKPGSKKEYRLLVFSVAGELWLEEVLGTEVEGIGSDSFFIAQDTLILIKNKETLAGYAL